MKRLIKPTIIFLIISLFPVGIVSAMTTSFNNFTGFNHTAGCHADTTDLSVSGIVNLSSSSGIAVDPGETFNISAEIQGFSEAAGFTVTLGFSSKRNDNSEFSFAPSQIDGINVNGTGNAIIQNFIATAPLTDGIYIIIVDALKGDGPAAFDWAYGSLQITVGNPSGGNDSPLGDLDWLTIIIILGTVVLVSSLLFFIVKKQKVERFFK